MPPLRSHYAAPWPHLLHPHGIDLAPCLRMDYARREPVYPVRPLLGPVSSSKANYVAV